MKRLLSLVFLLFLFVGCSFEDSKYSDKFWVTAAKAHVYKKPNIFSDPVTTLNFKDEVFGIKETLRAGTPKDWLQIKFAPNQTGFVELKHLGNMEKVEKIGKLIEETRLKQAQASGSTSKKSPIRLSPGRGAELIEVLKEPQGIEVFEKILSTYQRGDEIKKEAWYLIKLSDGRAGYLYSGNVKLEPPPDINMYTQSRRTVAWQVLGEKEDAETGRRGRDYIAAYAGTAISPGADFDRIEIYNYDVKSGQYSTSFAKSKMKGKLPINVIDKGKGDKVIQIRQMTGGEGDRRLVQEYSFPQPIKLVNEFEE